MKKLLVLLAAMMTFATTAFAQLGSLSSDLVFTPVPPCRIMDTRNPGAKSGILAAGTVRSFFGWNSTFAAQGGSPTTCGTLTNTNQAAIVVNFTVVTPDTGGYITAFPADAGQPLAATVNFTAGSVVGNNATLKLNQTGTGDDFKIYSTSNVHVVADIVGYYAKPVATELQCVNTAANSAPINSPGFGVNPHYYGMVLTNACASGYTEIDVRCTTNSATASASSYTSNNTICTGNSNENTYTLSGYRKCCRVPGR